MKRGYCFEPNRWYELKFEFDGVPSYSELEETLGKYVPYHPHLEEQVTFMLSQLSAFMFSHPRSGDFEFIGTGRPYFCLWARWLRVGKKIYLSVHSVAWEDREGHSSKWRVSFEKLKREALPGFLRGIFGERYIPIMRERFKKKFYAYLDRHGIARPPESFADRLADRASFWPKHAFEPGVLVIVDGIVYVGTRTGWFFVSDGEVFRALKKGATRFWVPRLFRLLGASLPRKRTIEDVETAILLAQLSGRLRSFREVLGE